mgnify:CR=1 FL=1
MCDETTWTALVEANWKLGDRLLFLTSPNLRGDDIAELQHGLSRLGFDCGRVESDERRAIHDGTHTSSC